MPRPPRILQLGPLAPNRFVPPKGQKPIYLPNFVLTLLRTPHAPPTWASFLTPLWLNKLDIKDYLYHLYGVKVLSVRSYVMQQKVRMDRAGAKRPAQNRWFRPRAIKKMTVEMAQEGEGQGPFVWPEPPEDLSPWGKESYDAAREAQDAARKQKEDEDSKTSAAPTRPDRKELAAQARALLEGRQRWRPGWMEYGIGGRRDLRLGDGRGVGGGGALRLGDGGGVGGVGGKALSVVGR